MEAVTNLLMTQALKGAYSARKFSEFVPCPYGCEQSHVGWIFAERGVKECECRKQKYRETKLAQIPPQYLHADLNTLQPKRHNKQAAYLKQLRTDPHRSYVLLGPHGCGKTTLAVALYRRAVEENRPAVLTYLPDLLEDLRQSEFKEDYIPAVSVDALSSQAIRAPRWLIAIDDFNVGRSTRFAGESLLRILNAAYNYRHQIVITAHCNMAALKEHWAACGEGYGGSIIRRLEESQCSQSCATGALVMNFFADNA